ncbi:MAG: prenyltransferase/squalene oxidase repeat-containing protein [Verrucomicrobiia bacterium]|jgi:squalene-hopene/tetraprenyl-beta-curcumene cyclase
MNKLHTAKPVVLLAALSIALQVNAADISFRNELQIALNKGFNYLIENQNTNGYWSTAELPAITALALIAFQGDPEQKYRAKEPEFIKRGYDYLLKNIKPDGGIYKEMMPNYNTAISMMALVAANKPEYEPIIRKARQFLVSLQTDFDEQGKLDSPFDGGIGYGSRYKHSDMANTMFALEALYYTKHLSKDTKAGEKDLNYEAAIHFLQNCQNHPKFNTNSWVSEYPEDLGGFVYYPGHSMAGGRTNQTTGKVSLRSYGSISYAGLLSYIYANLKKDDPRVVAVYDWLKSNYTLDENPGMGQEGLFFYYHTMAKALSTYGVDELATKNGKKVNWRRELAMKLLNLQKQDGSWMNENNRWMEKDPILVTTYALIALEFIYRGV